MNRAARKVGVGRVGGDVHAQRAAEQSERSACKAAARSKVTDLAAVVDSKCRISSDFQDETKSVQSFGKTKLPPRNNCGRPQLHPPVCEASISSSIIQPGPEYKRWARGPANSAGCVVNLSDRPSLCMSLMGGQAAIGSSDHAVYTVDVPSGKFRKALYGGIKGHTEWVTCITHLPDGRILSGGMDSKLCLWDRAGSSCIDLLAHTASISNVKVPSNGFLALSSSYDKSILLWDLTPHKGYKPSSKPIASLRGHKAPVMAIAVSSICTQNSLNNIASGCRDGSVILWDACTASIVLDHKQAHTGHVTALECLGCADGSGPDIFLSGGQDGILQVWDVRARYPVHKDVLHSSAKGQGALSCICVSQHSACGCPMIVTGGADKVMKVVDPRFSFQVVHTLNDHRDFIYSLFASGSLVWSGSGNGSLLVHDLTNGKCLYGLGASADGAVRCIGMTMFKNQEYLVCTGDDGNVMIYSEGGSFMNMM